MDKISLISPISRLFYHKKLVLPAAVLFQENSLIASCYSLGKLKIKTSTPNRFKNPTID